MDFDWDNHHVIYHGWKRPGWVNHARPYVHVDNVYVHKSKPYINNNWRHDASHGTPDSYRIARPGSGSAAGMKSRMFEIKGRSVTTAPTTPSQNVKKQPAITVPSVSQRPEMPVPVVSKGTTQSRPAGESLQRSRTPSVTFGGYRGGDEAKGQSLRGQASRQSSEKSVRSSTTPAAKGNAPEKNGGSRGNAPEGKENAGDKSRR